MSLARVLLHRFRSLLPGLSFAACIILLLTVGITAVTCAQTAKTAMDGIYTGAQAARGGALYQDNCSACHGGSLQGEEENPALSGRRFATHWGGLPMSALYGFINTQMPLGQPGSLGAQANIDIVAYILSVNKFPAGQTELPADAEILSAIIVNKP